MSIHGDIRINHRVIGYWQAQCQPGKDGIHPYRWGATLNGVTVRGVLTHAQADGALALTSKVTAAAAIALAEATRAAESLAAPQPVVTAKQALELVLSLDQDQLTDAPIRRMIHQEHR